ncbi:MAG: peptidoglycan-binding protein [Deltaproteobacteria bacterium]|nr:peptidoglycan-binding protein [Deltaproteobacteria bacterium]
MRISGARPYVSPAVDRALERAPARQALRVNPDLLYQEITAPRADMSALIIDPRPERAHPLLRQEVEAMRLRAKLRERTPVDTPQTRSRAERDTQPGAAPPPPPGLRQRRPDRNGIAGRNRLDGGTVVERTDKDLPGAPTSTMSGRRATPPSTAALHSAVRGNRLIGRGYQGREVIELQTLLRRRGFNVSVSGTFDADTESAVRVVQRRAGLPASGLFDTMTMAALEGRLTSAS